MTQGEEYKYRLQKAEIKYAASGSDDDGLHQRHVECGIETYMSLIILTYRLNTFPHLNCPFRCSSLSEQD